MRAPCECEHIDHFDEETESAHPYGQECETFVVSTEMGRFRVCQVCASGHWKEVIRK